MEIQADRLAKVQDLAVAMAQSGINEALEAAGPQEFYSHEIHAAVQFALEYGAAPVRTLTAAFIPLHKVHKYIADAPSGVGLVVMKTYCGAVFEVSADRPTYNTTQVDEGVHVHLGWYGVNCRGCIEA